MQSSDEFGRPKQQQTRQKIIITKLLYDYFLPKKNLTFERSKFRAAVQKTGQGFMEYLTELKELRTGCEFDKYTPETAVIDQFIEKCSSARLRKQLLGTIDLTLDKLTTMARGEELSDKRAEVIENRLAHSTHEPVIKREPEDVYYSSGSSYRGRGSRGGQPRQQPMICYGCGSEKHVFGDDRCKAKDMECYKCGTIGHSSYVCRKGQRQSNPQYNRGQRPQHVKMADERRDHEPYQGQRPQHVNMADERRDHGAYQVRAISTDEWLFQASATVNPNHSRAEILVDTAQVEFIIDSGATCDIIDMSTFQAKFKNQVKVYPTDVQIHTYGAKEPLALHGVFYPCLTYNSNRKIGRVIVAKAMYAGCILSKTSSVALGLLAVKEAVNMVSSLSTESIINDFPEVFSGLGKLKGFKLKLDVDTSVKPIVQAPRKEPYHKKAKITEAVQKLLDDGIIEPATGPTEWCSPLHAVAKQDGSIRLCVDMRKVNEAILRTRFPIPTLDDAIEQISEAGSAIFSKVDLNQGYHQIELAEESRNLTTFSCSLGIFRYLRLIFGVSSALEHFQYLIAALFLGEKGIVVIYDDILIHGATQEEHDKALVRCLEILRENHLTLNKGKCMFNKREIEFFGFTISKRGIQPTVSKVAAIKSFPAPKNAKEVRSFLGLINYLIRFIPNLATHTYCLRMLTKKDCKFVWSEVEQEAFENLKDMVTSETVLKHFITGNETKIVVDASQVGLGAILLQEQEDKNFHPVMYSSRSLTETESRYSQTEREALGVIWGCEKFRLYLIGHHFEIETDHQPLLTILGVNGQPSLRVQGWVLRLQPYNFRLKYIKGVDNPADVLSRQPLITNAKSLFNQTTEECVNFTLAHALPKAMGFSEVVEASEKDSEVLALKAALVSGRWHENLLLKPFRLIKDELMFKGGIILRREKLFIPKELRGRILKIAHETHLGISKTKAMLREKVWWPTLGADVEEMVRSCVPCLSTLPANRPEPLRMTEIAGVWETVHIDVCGPFPDGVSIVGVIDQCSRYPMIFPLTDTTAPEIIKRLERCFFDMGVPKKIISDNGTQFTGGDFKKFCEQWGIKHHKIIPLRPESNSEIERYFRTLLKSIRIAYAEGKDWKHELLRYIFSYRNTPHSSTGVSPASLIFNGRVINDKLPMFPRREPKRVTDARRNDNISKSKMKKYADRKARRSDIETGDFVLLKQKKRNKFSTSFSRKEYEVTERAGVKLILRAADGQTLCRHVVACCGQEDCAQESGRGNTSGNRS